MRNADARSPAEAGCREAKRGRSTRSCPISERAVLGCDRLLRAALDPHEYVLPAAAPAEPMRRARRNKVRADREAGERAAGPRPSRSVATTTPRSAEARAEASPHHRGGPRRGRGRPRRRGSVRPRPRSPSRAAAAWPRSTRPSAARPRRAPRRASPASPSRPRRRSSRRRSIPPAQRATIDEYVNQAGREPAEPKTDRCMSTHHLLLRPPRSSHEPNGFWLPHDLNEVIWGTIAFLIVFGLLLVEGAARRQEGLTERTERHRHRARRRPRRARAGRGRARPASRPRSPTPTTEAARIVDRGAPDRRARSRAEIAARADADAAERPGSGPPPTSRRSKPRPWPTSRPSVAALALGAAEAVVARQPRRRRPAADLIDELHRPGRDARAEASDDDRPASTLYADAVLADHRRPRARSTRSRTSCSASPGVVEGNDELRSTLTDPHLPAARRQQIVEDLLGGKAHRRPPSPRLAGRRRRPRRRPADDRRPGRSPRTAARRGEAVAEVRSAVPLTDDQQARLAAALSQGHRQGRRRSQVIVDPSVLGGVVTQIGDTVIDGSRPHPPRPSSATSF